MRAGRVPHREVVDGALVIFGGAFLITPGFLTDILGVMLLLPPTRALIRRRVQKRMELRAAGSVRTRFDARPPGHDYDVDGTAYERDDPAPELPPPTRYRRPR
jgi:UPF0716 protein FxsA